MARRRTDSALEAKLVDAADLSYPFDVQAEKKGYRVLWDARIEVPYPSMSVVTRKKTIQEDRDTVARMMRAHVEGIHFLKTQKEASLKILAKYLRTNDKELLEGSYEIYKEDFLATPYPITQGLADDLRIRRAAPAGNLQSQARRVHRPEFHRRARQERLYQETVRAEVSKGARH